MRKVKGGMEKRMSERTDVANETHTLCWDVFVGAESSQKNTFFTLALHIVL